MTATTSSRNTPERDPKLIARGVAASTKINAGSLVAINAAGYAVPGSVATTQKGQGRAEETVDNTGGSNGTLNIRVRRGVFQFANSASGDLITIADIGNNCYIVDDQTVAKTNGTNTRSVAGVIDDVDSLGVWVKFV